MILYLLLYYFEAKVLNFLPERIVRNIQLRKLRRLLNEARNRSSFYKKVYKDAGVYKLHLDNFESIKKIPIVDKEMMHRSGFDSVLTCEKTEKLVMTSTSGSTGNPIQIFSDKKAHFTSYVRTFLALQGYNPLKKVVVIGILGQKEKIEKKSFLHFLQRHFKMFERESYDVNEPIEKVVEALEGREIGYFLTMPSVLRVLITEMKKLNAKLKVRYVVLAGETLTDEVKEAIKKYLGAKIINVYGCNEHLTQAWTKPDGECFRYPLNSVIIEYTNCFKKDGKLYGEMVITNLVNKTMPFIRYNIGDHVEIHESYKKMGRVIGRSDDILKLKNGREIYAMQLYKFSRIKGLKQYKFLQKKNKEIVFQAVCNEPIDLTELRKQIEFECKAFFKGHPCSVEFVKELPLSESGKFKKVEVV